MDRINYYNLIEEKLSFLAFRIERRGCLNLLDLHIHSENFYLHLFNLLFGWDLKNLNENNKNTPGIDLVDSKNKIIIQVSATATKHKIESALSKDLSRYTDFNFKFISISKKASDLRTMKFSNPHNIKFSPIEDIFDIDLILSIILNMNINRQKEIFEFLRNEIKIEPDQEKIESNLTTIIQILSRVDWSKEVTNFETLPYDPEAKISYNQLDTAKVHIDDHKIHFHRIEKIYSDFDKQGLNKSLSILNGLRTEYRILCTKTSPDNCFYLIIEKVKEKIRMSANYTPIPDEELELCVQILVVDAFIRCKIFKNPSGGSNAST